MWLPCLRRWAKSLKSLCHCWRSTRKWHILVAVTDLELQTSKQLVSTDCSDNIPLPCIQCVYSNYLVSVLPTLRAPTIVLIGVVQVVCFGPWEQHNEDTESRAHGPGRAVGWGQERHCCLPVSLSLPCLWEWGRVSDMCKALLALSMKKKWGNHPLILLYSCTIVVSNTSDSIFCLWHRHTCLFQYD